MIKTYPKTEFLQADCLGNKFLIVDLQKYTMTGQHNPLNNDLRYYLLGMLILSQQDTLLAILPADDRTAKKLIILERDGTQSLMCGNGLLALATYLNRQYGEKKSLFMTGAGLRQAEVKADGTVQADLGGFHYENAFIQNKTLFYLGNVGEPHAITFAAEETKDEIFKDYGLFFTNATPPTTENFTHASHASSDSGAINNKTRNLNVVTFDLKNRQLITNRTFERGVNAETMACGTGSACAAAIYLQKILGQTSGVVEVKTRLGSLKVNSIPGQIQISTSPRAVNFSQLSEKN